ncbi:MAG: hypothetical protein WC879_17770 [Melioribacteraceae bacterium]
MQNKIVGNVLVVAKVTFACCSAWSLPTGRQVLWLLFFKVG